jgi:hypothetical protein
VPRRGVRGEVGSVFVMFDGVHGGWQVRICGLLPGVLACRMMHFLLSITLACILYEVYYWVCSTMVSVHSHVASARLALRCAAAYELVRVGYHLTLEMKSNGQTSGIE